MRSLAPSALLVASLALPACGPSAFKPPRSEHAETASPLGPSYVLLPVPGEEESLLGRVLLEPPKPGRSLEETARPNPCAEALTKAKAMPLASTYEDAQEISAQAGAKAMLGTFGFESDIARASHFFYKIETQKRLSLSDTNDYVACCQKSGGCGIGFVSALVYGDGEYATAEETSGSAQLTVATVGGGGAVALKVLHKRKVHGYLAALVTLTGAQGAQGAQALGPLGAVAQEPTIPDRVRVAYEREKVSIVPLPQGKWLLATGQEALTENEFVRRYESVTGRTDLRGAETRKNTGTVVTLGLLSAASWYGVYWGLTNLQRPCETSDIGCWELTPEGPSGQKSLPAGGQCVGDTCTQYVDTNKKVSSVGGILVLSFSGIFALTLTPTFIYSLFAKDGDFLDHSLTQDDARLYLTRYNRAALKKAGDQVEREVRIEKGAGVRLWPTLGPQGLGLGGTF